MEKSIGLCMIVKNESHVIERCLNSAKRLIDFVLIFDTGSTDGTQQVIRNWLETNGIGGEVFESSWVNFAYNRTEALEKMVEYPIDYSLMIDADEVLSFEPDFDTKKFKESLNFDYYLIQTKNSGILYHRPQLTKNRSNFRYEGVVHEFLVLDGSKSFDYVWGFYNIPIQDSNRNKSGRKFLDDILLLEESLSGELSDYMRSRYTFYLAQSYRDSGNWDMAIKNYQIRSKMGFWKEEEYVSLYNIANIKRNLNHEIDEVIDLYFDAFEHSPHRLEPIHWIIHLLRLSGRNSRGYIYGRYAVDNLKIPDGSLFVENWIYEYGILDEFSICAFYSGRGDESIWACNKLLSDGKIPPHYVDRIKNNINFCNG
jgi:hypothetical protein